MTAKTAWEALGRATCRRMIAGHCLACALPLLVVGIILISSMVYFCRSIGASIEQTMWLTGASSLLLLGLCWWRMRDWQQFGRMEAAFTRLDAVLKLNNALIAAHQGVGKWPEVPAGAGDRLRLQWVRILSPLLLAVAALLAAIWLPQPATATGAADMPPPRTHEDIAATLAELEKAAVLKPEDLKEWQKQFEAIQEQAPSDWYRHSSLEAADNLQSGMQEKLHSLASELNQARNALAGLESAAGNGASAEAQQQLLNDFRNAVNALKKSNPAPNEALMEALSKMDPSAMKSMDPKALEQMMEGLKKAAGGCQNCSGNGSGRKKPGSGAGEGEELAEQQDGDEPGNEPQSGGIKRGPGVAPLPLSQSPTDLQTNRPESMNSEDFSRTRPGDAIGTTEAEHQLDQTPVGPQNSGAAADAGKGGEAVWQESLLPAEKAVLKQYFK